jgi:hypothetical protein
VVDATLNPDFSQVALDVPQLAGNTRFALSLAEKRPFFYESADLLRTPTEALYTRSFTQPRGGLRATWRGTEWAGSAFAIRDEGRGSVLLPGAFGTDFAEQPASDSLTVRARSDIGGLAWGGLVAARRYEQGRGDNTVLGPDVAWQLSPQWRLRGQWLHARTTARPDGAGELVSAVAVDGDRLRLRLLRNADDGETSLGLDDISTGFRHDTGFVNQAGIRKFEFFHSLGWRNVGPLNDLYVDVDFRDVRDKATGALVQQVIRPSVWGTAARNLEWWFAVFARSQLRTTARAPLMEERFFTTGLVVTPASWFPRVEASIDWGRMADTAAGDTVDSVPQGLVRRGGRASLTARLRPLRALELEPRINAAWLDRDGVRTYREVAQQWLAVWHFDARHSLRAILQRSTLDRRAEPGVAATNSLSHTESLTYSWRQSAGSRLYVGATRARQGRAAPERATEAFIKLELDIDELQAWVRPSAQTVAEPLSSENARRRS